MKAKQKLTVRLIIGVLVIVALVKIFAFSHPKAVDTVAARTKGYAQAKVQIIEFIDFQCPACAAGSRILHDYMVKYPQDIRLQVKYFPLMRMHQHAMQAALYSECAARQGKFWEFHELLMPQQPQWSPLLNADPFFQNVAREAGVDKKQLDACLSSAEASRAIDNDRSLGQSLGIQSTPTYFINNKMIVGVKSLEEELKNYFGDAYPR